MINYGIFFVIFTVFSTLLGGLTAIRFKDKYHLLSSLAAGVLVGVPFFDLLPESISLAIKFNYDFKIVLTICAIGFVFLLILDRYITVHRICDEEGCRNERHKSGGFFGASELSIHSFLDGFAIGTAFIISPQVGLIVAIAVIAHDFSDGLNTVTVMISAGNPSNQAFKMLLLDSIAPLIGFIVAVIFAFPESTIIYLLPFFAGGFLYLGASDLLPEAHEKNPPIITVGTFIAGLVFIFIAVSLA